MIKKLMFTILLMLQISALFSACGDPENHKIEISKSANNSSGSYWKYELSTDNVIEEVDYHADSFPLNPGPGYTQYWTFEIINAGEVTIKWLAYEGDKYTESSSYSVTYVVDDDGKYYIKSDNDSP